MKRNTVIMITVAGIFFLLGTLANIASSWLGRRPIPMINGYTSTGYISRPAYDSGWMEWNGSTMTLCHNLNTTEVVVYLIGKNEASPLAINIIEYGRYAYWWGLTSTHISLQNPCIEGWHQVRVMIWKIP